MKGSKTSARYAKALFSCKSTDEEKLMHSQALSALSKEIKEDPSARQFFQNPFISIVEKKDTLQKALKNADQRLIDFLELLIKSNRFQELQNISIEYQTLLSESNKTVEATLVFAEAMDAKTKDLFKKKLEENLKKKVEITEKIDPTILGGFILIIAGKIVDLSLRGKLNNLKERFYSKKV